MSTNTPLFDIQRLQAIFPGVLPVDSPASMTSALTTCLTECADACNKAGNAGSTPLLVLSVLRALEMILNDCAKQLVADYTALEALLPPVLPPPPVDSPAPQPATPGPDWVDAAGQTYADWLASVAAAQALAANLGTPYAQGPTPVFTAPTGG